MKTATQLIIGILIGLFLVPMLHAQERKVRWERSEPEKLDLHLFHSPHAINLPTAETLKKGDWEFEISHRFLPLIDDSDALYGLDGPVNMRMALGYAWTNRLVTTIGRSNVRDNVDLTIKHKTLQLRHETFPVLIGFQGGFAWNTAELPDRDRTDSKNFQYFGQLIANTLYKKKLGIGLVQSYLHNTHIECEDTQHSWTLGGYLQYYVSELWSVQAEANFTQDGFRNQYDSFAIGIELETGGHFFKIFLTNGHRLNQTQYLAGADLESDLRLGFMITRLLKF